MTPLSPITHLSLDIFLLGFITAASLAAAIFFLRFWRSSKDTLFLAFVLFFVVQMFRESYTVSLTRPNAGALWLYLLRFLAVLAIVAAIVRKNFWDNR
jgi:predicted permease